MEWQPIEGHSHYEVNTIGDVREIVSGRVLGQWRNSQGYCLVRLSRPRVAEQA